MGIFPHSKRQYSKIGDIERFFEKKSKEKFASFKDYYYFCTRNAIVLFHNPKKQYKI